MDGPTRTLLDLLRNLSLIVILAVFHGMLMEWRARRRPMGQVATGMAYGLMASAVMAMPVQVAPGIIYDGRSIVLSMAGLFAGPLATAVAAGLATISRASLGGTGTVPGIGTIWTCAALGLLYRRIRQGRLWDIPWRHLFAFGLVAHLATLAWQTLLPEPQRTLVFREVAPWFLGVFSLGTMLAGWLWMQVERRVRHREEEILGHLRAQEHLGQQLVLLNGELLATNREIRAFAYGLAHDLQAPIRAIRGYAAILRAPEEDPGDRARTLDLVQAIERAAERMEGMIGDLMAYSRVLEVAVVPEKVDLNAVVAEAWEAQEPDAQRCGATLEVPETLPQVLGHRLLLTQVMTNLLGNAVKFVAPGVRPQVRVRAVFSEDRWVRVMVEDNGIGVPPEHRERIFQAFERLHGRETYPGTGVGLAVVRKAVSRMGGRCGVEAGPGGVGSRFWFELDRADLGLPEVGRRNGGF